MPMTHDHALTVTLPGGRRVDVETRGHVIHTDQPLDNRGTDTAASPFELFLASIGACAGIFVEGFCAARSIPTAGIVIVEHPFYDDQGTLRSVELDVELPADFPERYKDAVMRTIEGCSVKRAIAAQPEIEVSISTRHDAAAAMRGGQEMINLP
jgi:ribosomal protein S12 methylthiotransferase accessory factor